MSKFYSFLPSLLVFAIAGLSHMAVAIQLSDFTAASTPGYCVDGAGKAPTWAESPMQQYTDATAMKNFCVSYCGQNLETTFLGFETLYEAVAYPNEFYCNCVFNLPTFPDPWDHTTPFPYTFTPFPYSIGGGPATAIVDGSGKDWEDGYPKEAYQCYIYKGTPSGTPSPTGSHTPAPTAGPVGASDFTYLGKGDCVDSKGDYFSSTISKFWAWTNQNDGAAKCTDWCGQNINANFRAFVVNHWTINSPPDYRCQCYFDLPGQMPPYYGYNPPRVSERRETGNGTIVKIDGSGDNFCYKWNGTSGGGGGGGTPAPTKAPSKPIGTLHPTKAPTKPIGTLHPTKAPTKPIGTLHPTKAPTKPGSCPVGHPSCVKKSDCPSGSVFSHCVDGCCASLGSKSAKKAKSSKRA